MSRIAPCLRPRGERTQWASVAGGDGDEQDRAWDVGVLGWIAGGRNEEEFWPVHSAVLGWLFDLASWRALQGMDGGRDGVDSRLWQVQFEQFGAQVVGRSKFDYGVEA